MRANRVTLDGNEAAASIAYRLSDVISIYPITPSSTMGELADQWSADLKPNLWGAIPTVMEMQSEAGAAGSVHGALQAGALATTFTASQGLLLMLPNMYKIAGELTPAVFHVAARAVATHALSIFGDHSDVMSARSTGWAMLCSGSVQEAHDLALVAHSATLSSRIPFLHFFDGFRTSHEVTKIDALTDDDLRALIDDDSIRAHRERALAPERSFIRGTAQNPDVFFQSREAANSYYNACVALVAQAMDRFGARTGRYYKLFDYVGHPQAERVLVMMGSGAEVAHEAIEALVASGEKVGLIKVRLYRPFSAEHLLAALPASARQLAVLDRCKEPGALGEPLFLDTITALAEAVSSGQRAVLPRIIGGRYGLASKEFTPAMAKAVLDELQSTAPRPRITVGIQDDVTHLSVDADQNFSTEQPGTVRCLFYGLGSDGTVGANKNSIKILGEETELFVQGYFVYDSKKSGSTTVSHLRFGPHPIRSSYLIDRASFVACHQEAFLERLDLLEYADKGATFLLNTSKPVDRVWSSLPRPMQEAILARGIRLWAIDAARVAQELGLGKRINTVMQACFFAISGVLPRAQAISAIKHSIEKSYGARGQHVVDKNVAAVDAALASLAEVPVPEHVTSQLQRRLPVAGVAPSFVRDVTARLIAGQGDKLPVSAFPADGTWPRATARYEKRAIATEAPVWDSAICIQCGKCVMVCPHAVIRSKVCQTEHLSDAPAAFKTVPARFREFTDWRYTLQVSLDDCTGCGLCIEACPVKNKSEVRLRAINMMPIAERHDIDQANWDYFLELPEAPRDKLRLETVKDLQLAEPLFEFSGACAGCGETPYLKLLTQLFGDRALIANATGCSSIYGGNLPTTPWTQNREGRGPAWANSLFEDNAEFGLGLRMAVDQQAARAAQLVEQLATQLGAGLAAELIHAEQRDEAGITAQRQRVLKLQAALARLPGAAARELETVAEALVKKSVWIVGGDGWAYDIGFGGLDHVLATGRNINLVVLDTEVYSNTGGQMSKSTPRGAVAKFAAAGKPGRKKDLALLAIGYGNAYVAQVAFGADDGHVARVFAEAEAHDGPSLIICYSPCIAHGFDLVQGLSQQKAAVASGHWPLFHYDPAREARGENPLVMDSKPPSLPLARYIYNETRYSMLAHAQPERARALLHDAEADTQRRWNLYRHLSAAGPSWAAPAQPLQPVVEEQKP